MKGCTDCSISGGSITGIYRRTSNSDNNLGSAGGSRAIDVSGSNTTISGTTITDAGWAIVSTHEPGETGETITGTTITRVDHAWVLAFDGPANYGSFTFDHNTIGDYANWDSSGDLYHHDGIHCFTFNNPTGAAAHFSSLAVTRNTFNGDPGVNNTADIFLEGGSGPGSTPCADSSSQVTISGNTFTASQSMSNGLIGIFSTNPVVTSNTFNSPGTDVDIQTPATGGSFTGNTVTGQGTLVWLSPSSFPAGAVDQNGYHTGNSNAFVCGPNFFSPTQFASWRSCIRGDVHSTYSP